MSFILLEYFKILKWRKAVIFLQSREKHQLLSSVIEFSICSSSLERLNSLVKYRKRLVGVVKLSLVSNPDDFCFFNVDKSDLILKGFQALHIEVDEATCEYNRFSICYALLG
ncbi:hypothetical protein XENOCAPTIV_029996 [Xenoophorus captivus]|uniref:Uncharacterized protein n=1 Tax=Xenoophorus captivus TaxID=1517983 RepID=A0ABV0SFC1_9TELE